MSLDNPATAQIETNSIPRDMYAVSGFTGPDTRTYLRDKKQDDVINKYAIEHRTLLDTIRCTSHEKRAPLIRQVFLSEEDLYVQRKAADMIESVSSEEQTALRKLVSENIAQALSQNNTEIQKKGVLMIPYAPSDAQAKLLRRAISLGNIDVLSMVVQMIQHDVSEEASDLRKLVSENIAQALSQNNTEIQKKGVLMIPYAPSGAQANLLRSAISLGDIDLGDIDVLSMVVQIIQRVPEEADDLWMLLFDRIAPMLKTSPHIEAIIARMLWFTMNDDNRYTIIEEALSSKEFQKQKNAVHLIKYTPTEMRANLIRKAFAAGLGSEVVKSPLYDTNDLHVDHFKRMDFEKTDSEITLLGGALKDKLIIRHIPPSSFLVWQKTYEDFQIWKQNNFNYVPIEPIQSYRFNENTNTVAVFSVVLDLNLAMWEHISGGLFLDDLQKQRDHIIDVLEKQRIQHGHIHDGNFALRFFRDEHGNPNIKDIPRLYAIDFDQAYITP